MLKTLMFTTSLMVAGAALAQTAAPPPAMPGKGGNGMAPAPTMAPTAPAKLSAADKKFVDKIASANAAEIQAAHMAQQKSSDPHIKDIAQTILTDHTEAGQKLNTLAQQKGLTIPTELEAKDQKVIDKFSKLDGKKFDKEYVKDETKGHKEVLTLLAKETSSGKDPDVKAFASEVTPTIQKHLDMLQTKS